MIDSSILNITAEFVINATDDEFVKILLFENCKFTSDEIAHNQSLSYLYKMLFEILRFDFFFFFFLN